MKFEMTKWQLKRDRSPDNCARLSSAIWVQPLAGKQTSGRCRFARSALFRPGFQRKRYKRHVMVLGFGRSSVAGEERRAASRKLHILDRSEAGGALLRRSSVRENWATIPAIARPSDGGDKIALMNTIPKMSAELDRCDPAKRENQEGRRKPE